MGGLHKRRVYYIVTGTLMEKEGEVTGNRKWWCNRGAKGSIDFTHVTEGSFMLGWHEGGWGVGGKGAMKTTTQWNSLYEKPHQIHEVILY